MTENIKLHQDLRNLANGINFAIASMNGGQVLEFMLIVVTPSEDGLVQLNTITGIQESAKIYNIGKHLIDMAKMQPEPSLDPNDDTEVQGHA